MGLSSRELLRLKDLLPHKTQRPPLSWACSTPLWWCQTVAVLFLSETSVGVWFSSPCASLRKQYIRVRDCLSVHEVRRLLVYVRSQAVFAIFFSRFCSLNRSYIRHMSAPDQHRTTWKVGGDPPDPSSLVASASYSPPPPPPCAVPAPAPTG